MNNKDADQLAQMHRLVCVFVVRMQEKQFFMQPESKKKKKKKKKKKRKEKKALFRRPGCACNKIAKISNNFWYA